MGDATVSVRLRFDLKEKKTIFFSKIKNLTKKMLVGVQRGVHALQLHAAAVRVRRPVPGPVLGQPGPQRPAHPAGRLQETRQGESVLGSTR